MSLESENIKLANYLINRFGIEASEKAVDKVLELIPDNLFIHWLEVKKEIAKQKKTNKMTPKEKAVDLIKKHLKAYDIANIALESSFITVDEILIETNTVTTEEVYTDNGVELICILNPRIKYWQKVRQELEDLQDTTEFYELG